MVLAAALVVTSSAGAQVESTGAVLLEQSDGESKLILLGAPGDEERALQAMPGTSAVVISTAQVVEIVECRIVPPCV